MSLSNNVKRNIILSSIQNDETIFFTYENETELREIVPLRIEKCNEIVYCYELLHNDNDRLTTTTFYIDKMIFREGMHDFMEGPWGVCEEGPCVLQERGEEFSDEVWNEICKLDDKYMEELKMNEEEDIEEEDIEEEDIEEEDIEEEKTVECIGCLYDMANQQGHYGGCIKVYY